MEKSLTIESNPTPFSAYLAILGLLGVLVAKTEYVYSFPLVFLFCFLIGWRHSIKFIYGDDLAIYKRMLFGATLLEERIPLSKFRIIRNRIHFNGTRLSGNTCVTELVDSLGGVFRVREESVGFSDKESREAKEFIEKLSEITSIPKGNLLDENP